jgi:hypothetical protein
VLGHRGGAADPGSGTFLTAPDPGWKNIQSQDPGSGKNIPDLIFENLILVFGLKIVKFFDADPGSGNLSTLDPGWKKSDSGFEINILDSQHKHGVKLIDLWNK